MYIHQSQTDTFELSYRSTTQIESGSRKVKCKSHLPNVESNDNLIRGDKLRTPSGGRRRSHTGRSLVNSYLLWRTPRHLSPIREIRDKTV